MMVMSIPWPDSGMMDSDDGGRMTDDGRTG
jgi:hypothetical protein